jgi:hypothetical protein
MFCFSLTQFDTELTQEDKTYTLKKKKLQLVRHDFYNCLNDFARYKCTQLSLRTAHKKLQYSSTHCSPVCKEVLLVEGSQLHQFVLLVRRFLEVFLWNLWQHGTCQIFSMQLQ